MTETLISQVYDAATGSMVQGYPVSDIMNYINMLGQGLAGASVLFIVTLVAWALVRETMSVKEASDDE